MTNTVLKVRISDKDYFVTVILNKGQQPDIILIDLQTKKAKSNRSPTELLNTLLKAGIKIEEIKEVSAFINRMMIALQVQENGNNH